MNSRKGTEGGGKSVRDKLVLAICALLVVVMLASPLLVRPVAADAHVDEHMHGHEVEDASHALMLGEWSNHMEEEEDEHAEHAGEEEEKEEEEEAHEGETDGEHHAEESGIQFGAPLAAEDCVNTTAITAFYAGRTVRVSEGEVEGYWLVEPSPPECGAADGIWHKLHGAQLVRRCEPLSVMLAFTAKSDTQTHDELVATVMVIETGGFCSTLLERANAGTVAVSSLPFHWQTWTYAMLAVLMCCIVSLVGICLLWWQQVLVQRRLVELMALSCGTFLGSVFFSILPEAATELGFGVNICSIVLGGVLFGFLSEAGSHAFAEYLVRGLSAMNKKPAAAPMQVQAKGSNIDVEMVAPDAVDGDPKPHTVVVHMDGAPASGADRVAAKSLASSTSKDGQTGVVPSVPTPAPHTQHAGCNHAGLTDGDADLADHEHSCSHSGAHAVTAHELEHGDRDLPAPMEPADKDIVAARTSNAQSVSQRLARYRHLAIVNCVADLLHNFIDGALIGATFLVDVRTGWLVTVAILLHELPQELADYSTLTKAGLTPRQALGVNFAISLSSFIGAIIAIEVGEHFATEVSYVLPFAAGLFLYLALACLAPVVLQQASGKGLRRCLTIALAFALGIGIMAALLAVPWEHSHGGEESGVDDGHEH